MAVTIEALRICDGPNVWSTEPVTQLLVHLGSPDVRGQDRVRALADGLSALLAVIDDPVPTVASLQPVPFSGGLHLADVLGTVSPTYAREIQSGGEFGHGLEGVLRARSRDLVGILNGIDAETWDPSGDPFLAAPYDRDRMDGKRICKEALLAETQRAVERGTFGSPTFFVDNEIWFGKDRLHDVEEAIADALG